MIRWLAALVGSRARARAAAPGAALDDWMREAFASHERGELQKAEAIYRKILAEQPANPDALYLLGEIASRRGERAAARELIGQAITMKPAEPAFHLTLGCLFQDDGALAEAASCYREVLALEPRHREVLIRLGWVYLRQGELSRSIACSRTVLEEDSQCTEALNNLSIALLLDRRENEALEVGLRLVSLEPDAAGAHLNLGSIYKVLGRLDEAVRELRIAAQLDPASADAHGNLGATLCDVGCHAEAEMHLRRSLALAADRPKMHSNLLLCLNYRDDIAPEQVFAEHLAWSKQHAVPVGTSPFVHANERDAERRLRLGYVSADFRRHSVAYFAAPVIAAHDRARYEVICYSDVPAGDDVTEQFRRASDHWRDIFRLRDEELADLVRSDAVDILVDLAGHTGKHRLLAFARKPAPVQVTWLGYPNTTGLLTMDYRLSDAHADPPGAADRLHSERLVRLERGFLCYAPPPDSPDVTGPPLLAGPCVTFGCFNNLAKLGGRTIAIWARLLKSLPQASLLLKAAGLASQSARCRLQERFSAQGIEPGRVKMHGLEPSLQRHLAMYGGVDIALDVYPYNGATTTCEALWMGVPVVTLAGDRHASRVGASILNRVGLADLVAESADQYIDKASRLAASPARLAELRSGMRERLAASPLLDATSFTAQLEVALRRMWREWCAKH